MNKRVKFLKTFICISFLICLLLVMVSGSCLAAEKETAVKRVTIKSVEPANDEYIQIKWSKISNADGYQVYRATSKDGTYKRIATVKASKRTYNDKKLEAGEQYYYKVRAYDKVKGKKKYGKFSKKVNYLPKKLGAGGFERILAVGSDGTPVLMELPEERESGDVFGVLDGANNVLLTGNAAEGTYTLKYENKDGSYTEIGIMEVGTGDGGTFKIGETPFIPENIAPPDAVNIVVFDAAGRKVTDIPLGRMSQPTGEKLYSFGLISDIHLYPLAAVEWKPEQKFRTALSYFQDSGCVMSIQCGDISQTGFYSEKKLADGSVQVSFDTRQMAAYKRICEEFSMPTYGICGNHENYYSKSVADHLNELEYYMGKGATAFTISSAETTAKNEQVLEVGDDVFILIGQPRWNKVMSDDDFQWLGETLEANKDRRCFVFVHAYIEEDSGDAGDVRENSIFTDWGSQKTAAFMELLSQYENVILFHGHSHMKLGNQAVDSNANYTDRNGFKSVHVPSLSIPRDADLAEGKSIDDRAASEGYLVDVYEDCIVLNGRDFVAGEWIPLGVFRIDM